MKYSFSPSGVCSQKMTVELDGDGKIKSLDVSGGCSGNLQGISVLVQGMDAQEAIRRMEGIRCGPRSTSCPDQLARGLEDILSRQGS